MEETKVKETWEEKKELTKEIKLRKENPMQGKIIWVARWGCIQDLMPFMGLKSLRKKIWEKNESGPKPIGKGVEEMVRDTEAQKENKKIKNKQIRNKEFSWERNNVRKINEDNVNKDMETSGEKNNETREKHNQVVAEEQHVVTRGLNKGKIVARTVVEHNMDYTMMAIDLNLCNPKHHDDPPPIFLQDGDTVMRINDLCDDQRANELEPLREFAATE